MPEFATAFSGLQADRKLTHQELVRAVRFMIAAEYEAIQLYTQLADSTDNGLARAVLREISDEEREHAGEFYRLLQELSPDEESFYEEGRHETQEKIDRLKAQ
ncbi:MAG: rubrerythrin [Akkermansiaceae bacterium]|nr:rubrerythrin [Akkermansia sp.]MCD7799535.1 rubrerythrin [Akkermansiaceae bacterium]MCD8070429.1 rubrerythrin [Akkermansiaceae bacterium]